MWVRQKCFESCIYISRYKVLGKGKNDNFPIFSAGNDWQVKKMGFFSSFPAQFKV